MTKPLNLADKLSSIETTAPKPTFPDAPVDVSSSWRNRREATEPVFDQVNIRAPVDVIERFKLLCKSDRRKYADMLEILMNHFEGR